MSCKFHHPLECIQVYYHNIIKCYTNFNHWTTVNDLIEDFQNVLINHQHTIMISNARLYMKDHSYLYPLNNNEYIEDILVKNFLVKRSVQFFFSCSSTCIARRRRLSQISLHQSNDYSSNQKFQRRSSVDRDIDLLISLDIHQSISNSLHLETLV